MGRRTRQRQREEARGQQSLGEGDAECSNSSVRDAGYIS